MTLGEKIRLERNKRNISMETLADRCGLSRNTIYKIEKGLIYSTKSSTLKKICDTLLISMDKVCKVKK